MIGQGKEEKKLKELLTHRELQIVSLLSQDLSYQEIADCLQLSKRTVGFHVSNALHKTEYRSIVGLVVAFVKQEIDDATLK